MVSSECNYAEGFSAECQFIMLIVDTLMCHYADYATKCSYTVVNGVILNILMVSALLTRVIILAIVMLSVVEPNLSRKFQLAKDILSSFQDVK
jgi:hypothetical protein